MPIKQTAQQIAQNVARTTLNESSEVLKTAREQILPFPEKAKPESDTPQSSPVAQENPQEKKAQQLSHDSSFMRGFITELNDIKRDNLFKSLQQKISEGEDISIENYASELSSDQREVLRAQQEAVNLRKAVANENGKRQSPRELISKKGRQMFNKIKKRNEQHIETRQPPSS